MKKCLLFLSLVCCSLSAFSQKDVVYLNHAFYEVKKKEATYYRNTSLAEPPGEQKTETVYYLTGEKYSEKIISKNKNGKYLKEDAYRVWHKNGNLKEERVARGKETSQTKWHDNGQLYYKFVEVEGKKEGEAVGYYPNGNLRRRESFSGGQLIKGQCFKEDGTEVNYYPHFTPVQFPGGLQKMSEFWGRNFRVPVEAAMMGTSGVAVIQFQVEKTGKIGKIEVVKSLLPEVDKEAIRLIKLFPDFEPATEEGEPIDQVYTVPVRVILKKPTTKTGAGIRPNTSREN